VLVVEVSSFQLAYIEEFQPSVAVLLNIAEDHFDWHEDMEDYIAAKRRMWMNQGEEDLVVVNRDDPLCVQAARRVTSRLAYFSKEAGGAAVTFLKKGTIYSRAGEGCSLPEARAIMRAEELELPGEHNLENAMAAVTCALEMGVAPESVRESLAEFKGLEHRLQLVAEVNRIRFYNDSKATNPHATLGALSAFDGPVVLILGGRNKGLGFAELASEISGRKGVRLVYVIGEACNEIEEALASEAPDVGTRRKPGLEEVFQELHEAAEPGDSVLFSPACASFDRYDNYKQRGKHFQEMVERYRREVEGHG
jgi:UDP-N-acetylmuramoylalanine--D-glutamate ligase